VTAIAAPGTPALALLASFVLDDGRRWGEAAEPWQWDDVAAILAQAGCPYHYMTRPRGGSKTTDVAAISLAAMLTQAPPGARLFALAADRDQGRLLLEAIRGFVSRTPFLEGAIEISAYRVAAPDRDVVLEILAADAAGSWGLLPYFVVVDELAQWAETPRSLELFEAIRTATVKIGARLVIITTAGDPAHFANGVREHARADPLWRLHEVPGPVPWISSDLLEEQRRALPKSSFRRLHLNEWVESEDRLAALEDLRRLVTHEGPLAPRSGVSYVIGVDIGLVNDLTAAAVCHVEPIVRDDQKTSAWRIVVDRVETWRGSARAPVQLAEVRDWLVDAARLYRDVRVVIDPHQAVGTAQELRQHGVQVEEYAFSQLSVGRLAYTLILAVRNRAIALPNDPGLLNELARVRIRETSPNVFRLDHDRGGHNDRAIAIALAGTRLLEQAASPGPRFRTLR
jgi:phage terminase large subunit-like protein